MADRIAGMLKSADANNDGKLDLNEVPEYRRGFVKSMLERAGVDTSKPVALSTLQQKITQRMDERSRESGNDKKKENEDPLVPGFGEAVDYGAAAVEFGVRVEEEKPAYAAGAGKSSEMEQARGVISKYDRNKNGVIDRNESEHMRADPRDIDRNGDGRITSGEVVVYLRKPEDERNRDENSDEQPRWQPFRTAHEFLPEGIPDWFIANDKNMDGNLSMSEWSSHWTNQLADEFDWWDGNKDGVVTAEECLQGQVELAAADYTVGHPEVPPGTEGLAPPPAAEAQEEGGDGEKGETGEEDAPPREGTAPPAPAPPAPDNRSRYGDRGGDGDRGGYGGRGGYGRR